MRLFAAKDMSWIKIRTNLLKHPKTAAIGRSLGIAPARVLTLLYLLASWVEESGDYGVIMASQEMIDDHLGTKGAFAAIEGAGWLSHADGVTRLLWFTDVSGKRKGIGRRLRADVLSAGKCAKCPTLGPLEVDHIIPVKRGGKTVRENLQPLCIRCNRSKGAS